MRRLGLLVLVAGLLALLLAGSAAASEETHCYMIGDNCVVISNVCFFDYIDCGDGTTWESKWHWKKGWCLAAIYAGVISGTVEQCMDGSARTTTERVLISSITVSSSSYFERTSSRVESGQRSGNQEQPVNDQQQGNEQQQGNQQQTGNQQQQRTGEEPPQIEPPPQNRQGNDQQNQPETQVITQLLPPPPPPPDDTQYSQQQQGVQGEQEQTYTHSHIVRNGDGSTCWEEVPGQAGQYRVCRDTPNREGLVNTRNQDRTVNQQPYGCSVCGGLDGRPLYTPTTPTVNTGTNCRWLSITRVTGGSEIVSQRWEYRCT